MPDVAVFLSENPAADRKSFWLGGPDFAIEITSRGDKSRENFDFNASIHTREVLIVDRDPWQLELYRFRDGVLSLHERCLPGDDKRLTTSTVGFQLRVGAAKDTERPELLVSHPPSQKEWTV